MRIIEDDTDALANTSSGLAFAQPDRCKNALDGAGIHRIAGAVVGDKSYFDSRRTAPGWLKFVVVGQNGTYVMSATRIPARSTMVIDSPFATTGQCGEAFFTAGRAAGPAPHCSLRARGKTLVCK